jgi:hypothetical protein
VIVRVRRGGIVVTFPLAGVSGQRTVHEVDRQIRHVFGGGAHWELRP